jgi:hypothetical protein
MYKIVDWAGNTLTHKGILERPEFAVPKLFTHFDAASDYIHDNLIAQNLTDQEYEHAVDEYYIVPLEAAKGGAK